MKKQTIETNAEAADEKALSIRRAGQIAWIVPGAAAVFLLGIGGGYLIWGRDETAAWKQQKEMAVLYEQVNPKDGYTLPVAYGTLGPRLLDAGVMDYDIFTSVMAVGGDPISDSQTDILKTGSEEKIVITPENAHFLLNFFWAVGLANRNSILTEGPMVQNSDGQIERFASTGGWTLATRPVTELYASLDLIPLTPEQQARVEEVAAAVYRPCCNNETLFPDCNHGMAMLGLLQLMASQGSGVDEMFQAAKYVNAYWFPQQAVEMAIYLKSYEGTDFASADARLVVSDKFSSASGAGMVHQALQRSGLLEQAPSQGGSCTN